jgi:hypothetical protein
MKTKDCERHCKLRRNWIQARKTSYFKKNI